MLVQYQATGNGHFISDDWDEIVLLSTIMQPFYLFPAGHQSVRASPVLGMADPGDQRRNAGSEFVVEQGEMTLGLRPVAVGGAGTIGIGAAWDRLKECFHVFMTVEILTTEQAR